MTPNGRDSRNRDDRGSDRAEGTPDVVAARDRILTTLLEFTRALEQAGVRVPANASVDATRALVEIGFGDKGRVRAALKATLVSRRTDLGTFDRLFETFWQRLTDDLAVRETAGADDRENAGEFAPIGADSDVDHETDVEARSDPDAPDSTPTTNWRPATSETEDENRPEGDDPLRAAIYSPTGRSERLSMPTSVLAERAAIDRALKRLTLALAAIGGRRWESGRGDRADARRALRRSFSTGGTVVEVPRRERKTTVVRCVLLVDVSRSVLDAIDRAFLIRFLRAATAEWQGARTFLFDTQVREVSNALAASSPEATVAAFRRAEAEWGGGTRIAEAISTVRREHPDAVDRTTNVFVISDGLEMGDINTLEDSVSWLSRQARLVLWGNPLAAAPEYEPTARGMAVSLPYVDGLFAFAGVDDVAEIARQLERRGTTAIGYQYDSRRRARE